MSAFILLALRVCSASEVISKARTAALKAIGRAGTGKAAESTLLQAIEINPWYAPARTRIELTFQDFPFDRAHTDMYGDVDAARL